MKAHYNHCIYSGIFRIQIERPYSNWLKLGNVLNSLIENFRGMALTQLLLKIISLFQRERERAWGRGKGRGRETPR